MYLLKFKFPNSYQEEVFLNDLTETNETSYYPFLVFKLGQIEELCFDQITIFYGGNGTGKTTALNIIAEKLTLQRDTLFNRTRFFEDYIRLCHFQIGKEVTRISRIITSDDVFDFMINIRSINDGIRVKRSELADEYISSKNRGFKLESMADYDELVKVNLSKSMTKSQFIRRFSQRDVKEQSNGESAFAYFTDKIKEDALYLLDEPENSLSPEKQIELLQFITDSARFYGCQFIIATHSPFLLSLKGARIYDFTSVPISIKKWTELKNVRTYYNFFKKYEKDFEK